jgi:hypothetical protein
MPGSHLGGVFFLGPSVGLAGLDAKARRLRLKEGDEVVVIVKATEPVVGKL